MSLYIYYIGGQYIVCNGVKYIWIIMSLVLGHFLTLKGVCVIRVPLYYVYNIIIKYILM